jgi:hypothetical protein
MADKRRYERQGCAELVNINTETRKDRAGLVRDVSPGGVLVLSRSKFAVGERVELMMHLPKLGYRKATGRVVRSSLPPVVDAFFPHPAAIELDQVDPELAGAIR